MSVIANLFSAAMYAFVLQNLIFTGGYGASEAVRMAAKPKQLFPLTAFITFFSTFGSIFCVLLEQIPFISALSEIQHSLIFLLAAADYASGHPYGSSLRPVQYAAEAFG